MAITSCRLSPLVLASLLLLLPRNAAAQPLATNTYTPITEAERVEWIVNGIVGPRSLFIGVLSSSWLTAVNSPEEWRRSWSGFGKRYGNREADVAISNTIEAGLGTLWGEDPRYMRAGSGRLWPRVRHALKLSVLAPGRDGRLRPAWARYTGDVVSNLAANSWLPPSVTGAGGTARRVGGGVLGRVTSNAFQEFWPDVRRRLKK